MIKHVFTILEAGSRLVVELTWCKQNPEQMESLCKLKADTLQYKFTLDGMEISSGKVNAYRIEIDLKGKKSGVYQMQLLADGVADGGVREFWKQFIFIQPQLKRSAERIHEIAQLYAPIFLFSRKEEYFPVSLSDLVESPTLRNAGGAVVVDTVFGKEEVPIGDLGEFLRFNGHSDYLLDQSIFDLDSAFREIRGDYKRSVVYYSYIEDKNSDRFFINYHTFYAFDPKTGIAKMFNIGPHVFDRESMTVIFNGDESPASVVLSGHLENQPILFLEKLKIWSTGRVRLNFQDEKSPAVKGHPIVPVAEGSHALYPTAGLYHISVLTEMAGHIFSRILPLNTGEDEPPEMQTHQVLLPPALKSDRFVNYELRPLRLDLLKTTPDNKNALYDPANAFLVFSGYWVDVPGFQNERFPPFSRKEKDIEEWIDQATEWEWKDLPPRITEHNQELSRYISASLK